MWAKNKVNEMSCHMQPFQVSLRFHITPAVSSGDKQQVLFVVGDRPSITLSGVLDGENPRKKGVRRGIGIAGDSFQD